MNSEPIPGLYAFTNHMTGRGLKVRRNYNPPIEIDGEWREGYWANTVYREELQPDGRIWIHGREISDEAISSAELRVWHLMADLVLAAKVEDYA